MAAGLQDTTSKLRRNGKRPSCEPCRVSKIACDHAFPVCGRCKRRALTCLYHPAPMTSSKEDRVSKKVARSSGSTSQSPVLQDEIKSPTLDLGSELEPSPGYLGSTSYLAVFEDGKSAYLGLGNDQRIENSLYKSDYMKSAFERITTNDTAFRIIKVFENIDIFDRIIKRVLEYSRHVRLPTAWIIKSWDSVKAHYGGSMPLTSEHMKIELDRLFENTSRPVKTHKSMTPDEFINAHIDLNMRWETIGTLLTMIASATKIIPKSDPIWSAEWTKNSRMTRQDICKQVMDLAEYCFRFCERTGVIGLIYLYGRMDLAVAISLYHGDNSYTYWTKFGNVVSACFATGLHEGASSNSGDDPFFLVELKKQALAHIYVGDKSISTLLGRPPRLPLKYCTLELPLDLTSSQLATNHSEVEAIMKTFDKDGWAPPAPGRRPVWSRAILPASILREEILELSLTPLSANAAGIADDIAQRSRQAIENLPSHLRYDAARWGEASSTSNTLSLLLVYLNYIYNDFLLQRVMVRRLRRSSDELLRLARQMLTDVLEVVSRQDRLSSYRVDLDWIIALYGLPAAGVLALELLRQKRTPVKDFPRSEVIQNLSVLVSCLGWAAGPEDGNYHLCKRAQQLLSQILDMVLSLDAVPVHNEIMEHTAEMNIDSGFGEWYSFDNLEYDGEFWNQLAEHPSLHIANMT